MRRRNKKHQKEMEPTHQVPALFGLERVQKTGPKYIDQPLKGIVS